MGKAPENDAANSTPAKSYEERLEQALLWAMWELSCDQAGHGGVHAAVSDMVPEFNQRELTRKGYPLRWPDSYEGDDMTNPEDQHTYKL